MKMIRRSLSILSAVAALTAVIGWAAPVPASASVPGAAFTETGCEGSSDSVARLYSAGLGRDPELEGFEFWLKEYTAGRQTFRSMAAFFVASVEFGLNYGSLSDEEFVKQIYRNILGREGDAGGIAFWSGELGNTATRATILMRFAESPENIAKSGTSAPTLGEFNEGRSEAWSCGDWKPTADRDQCVVTGRDVVNVTEFRVTLSNPGATRADGVVVVEGLVNGGSPTETTVLVNAVDPGEVVDGEWFFLEDAINDPAIETVTCRLKSITWNDVDPSERVDNACKLLEMGADGTWGIEFDATNPLNETSTAYLVVLEYLDGRRVNQGVYVLSDIAGRGLVRKQDVARSIRLVGVGASHIKCELVVVGWLPDS